MQFHLDACFHFLNPSLYASGVGAGGVAVAPGPVGVGGGVTPQAWHHGSEHGGPNFTDVMFVGLVSQLDLCSGQLGGWHDWTVSMIPWHLIC